MKNPFRFIAMKQCQINISDGVTLKKKIFGNFWIKDKDDSNGGVLKKLAIRIGNVQRRNWNTNQSKSTAKYISASFQKYFRWCHPKKVHLKILLNQRQRRFKRKTYCKEQSNPSNKISNVQELGNIQLMTIAAFKTLFSLPPLLYEYALFIIFVDILERLQ